LSLGSRCSSFIITTKRRWGQSAGGISIGSQLVTNRGDNEGLFRGAIMQSGSPQTTVDVSSGQRDYDSLVNAMGCAEAHDTLDCLRDVPYEKLKQGVEVLSPGMFTYKVSEWLTTEIVAADGCTLGFVVDMANHGR
jgi:carboxylesterase type B